MKNKRNIFRALFIISVAIFLLASNSAYAVTREEGMGQRGSGPKQNGAPAIFGKVTSISGNVITITASATPNDSTIKAYTIDAANSKVFKNQTSSAVSNIALGDLIMVQGAISGTNITASVIHDGVGRGDVKGPRDDNSTSTRQFKNNPIIKGDGKPVLEGSVTAISGTSISMTNKSNVIYTIDASQATVIKDRATSSVSNITVGDKIVVQGDISGTSVVATSIIDRANHQDTSVASSTASGRPKSEKKGFFNRMGGFFSRMFGSDK